MSSGLLFNITSFHFLICFLPLKIVFLQWLDQQVLITPTAPVLTWRVQAEAIVITNMTDSYTAQL